MGLPGSLTTQVASSHRQCIQLKSGSLQVLNMVASLAVVWSEISNAAGAG